MMAPVKKELPHFMIGSSYGGNQDWFRTLWMRMGGCGAETACDSSIYFALHKGIEGICPPEVTRLTREAYVDFAHRMEKYLWPRMTGIDRLEIFAEGYGRYLRDCGVDSLTMDLLDGSEPYEKAAETVRSRIDAGCPIPTLILNHRDRSLEDYVWHWFLLNGYEMKDTGAMLVKAVTYSEYEWLDLRRLWETGYRRRGGLILFRII